MTTNTEHRYRGDLAYRQFSGDKEMARAINEGTVLSTLPYRGERTQVVSTTFGTVGRVSAFGVIREPWFGDQASRWFPFPSVGAAQAWQQGLVAEMLRGEVHGGYSRHHYGSWTSPDGGWAVEVDRHRWRFTTVVGLAPGERVECFEALEYPEEPWQLAEERGWARLVEVLPVGPEDWPQAMASEYRRVQADAERRADAAEREAATTELADELEGAAVAAELAEPSAAPVPAAVEASTTGWWARFVGWLAALLRIGHQR
ncbi:hypothetical protein F7Q99_39005 [Streptomyces kaniharaensis]|uniref:Uncharacterized protein n=1 Tax=Streptomyces kaniharaensis TaxID=212423 RepID=A0A6N7L2D6_9ACTN|nr:hypothetical protein [Streptomyces kaniharaensis]MQS18022.1 hypothetical protein [Streptomyces kaniharaensis]